MMGVGVASLGITSAFSHPVAGESDSGSMDAYDTEDVTVESFDGTKIKATLYTSPSKPNPAVLITHG